MARTEDRMASQAHLLIVDDERAIASMLDEFFGMEGYRTTVATDGAAALAAVDAAERGASSAIDLVLLDVNMPGMDGFETCRRIRERLTCPIIFLTARVEDADQLDGFASGGDDYVLKPFSLQVLGSRVRAHLARESRRGDDRSARLRFIDGIVIDFAGRTVAVEPAALEPVATDDGEGDAGSAHDAAPAGTEGAGATASTAAPQAPRSLDLTRTEFDIVALLAKKPGRVYDRTFIYEQVWGWNAEGDPSIVREHVRRIRKKFAEAGCACDPIETVWGVGYRWGAR